MDYQQLVNKYKLSFKSRFIPFSQSRNKDSEYKSLNWEIALFIGGKEIVKTDFMASSGNCPAYNLNRDKHVKLAAILLECETGKEVIKFCWVGKPLPGKKTIDPDYESFLYSIVMDSSVLHYSDFSDWCNNYGYSSDSIADKGIYDACLTIALKLNSYLGPEFFNHAEKAFEDY